MTCDQQWKHMEEDCTDRWNDVCEKAYDDLMHAYLIKDVRSHDGKKKDEKTDKRSASETMKTV